MKETDGKQLLKKYAEGLCTNEEKALVETYYNLHQPANIDLSEQELLENLNRIDHSLPHHNRKRANRWPQIAAAAAVLLCLSFGLYMYLKKPDKQPSVIARNQQKPGEIMPGGNRAVLTLADGQKINLDDAKNGDLAKQAGVSISKTANGQLIYHITAANGGAGDLKGKYNTIETPAGGQYQVQLPDGTNVWLNARSSLRYPLVFSGNSREVDVTGEAYFEVAHNRAMPFRVKNPRQTIEVLGTHFNVMAYDDESHVETTLLQGSVKVIARGKSMMLSPGQQSQVASNTITKNIAADIDDVVAWKNGKLQFSDSDIHTIMRELARWYNIEVDYSGPAITTTFGGSVSRSKQLSAMLNVLESTGDVHFKIQGRRVTVMP